MERFSEFITEHQDDDTDRLLFARDRWPEIDMQKAVNTILTRRKLKNKLPSWYADAGLVYPDMLPSEQCSSEETAMYKASIAKALLAEKSVSQGTDCHQHNREGRWKIADLTGGLGADTWAFAKIADRVLYNEMNKERAEAAAYNFNRLNLKNILVYSKNITVSKSQDLTGHQETGPENIAASGDIATPEELLKDFQADMIYLDPARRSSDGRKVFLIEDCSPDILTLKDSLLALTPLVMVKLSPMADISMTAASLGKKCREIHVVSSGGECKELLVIMDRDWSGEYTIHAVEIGKDGATNTLSFVRNEESAAVPDLLTSAEISVQTMPSEVQHGNLSDYDSAPGEEVHYLFEPGKSLMKAGAFNLLCSRFGLKKFGRSTHLYITYDKETADSLQNFGKIFKIIDTRPFNNRTIKEVAAEYPGADVTARNLPVTSDALKAKMYRKPLSKIKTAGKANEKKNGGEPHLGIHHHIFALKSDTIGNLLIVATPILRAGSREFNN